MKQFTIGTMMAVVLLIAVGFAGLKNPTPMWASVLFTLAVSILCVTVVGAATRRGHWRPFLTGFSVFGWVYLALAFEFTSSFTTSRGSPPVSPPPLLTVKLLAYVYDQMPPPSTPWFGLPASGQGMGASPTAGMCMGPQIIPASLAFYQVGQSLAAMLAALIGGIVASLLASRDDLPRRLG